MRFLMLPTTLIAFAALAGCEGTTAIDGSRGPVGEDAIACYEWELLMEDPTTGVTERARARDDFFANDCVQRSGLYGTE